MRQKAVVLETKGKIALIEVSRATMCDGCEKKSGCAGHCEVSVIMSGGGKMTAKAENAIGAVVGEQVEVETESKRVLGYAALVFLLPILICAAFYALADVVTQNDSVAALAAVAGFILTFAGIAFFDRQIAKKEPDIVIVKRFGISSNDVHSLEDTTAQAASKIG